jgi:hypothetical protein
MVNQWVIRRVHLQSGISFPWLFKFHRTLHSGSFRAHKFLTFLFYDLMKLVDFLLLFPLVCIHNLWTNMYFTRFALLRPKFKCTSILCQFLSLQHFLFLNIFLRLQGSYFIFVQILWLVLRVIKKLTSLEISIGSISWHDISILLRIYGWLGDVMTIIWEIVFLQLISDIQFCELLNIWIPSNNLSNSISFVKTLLVNFLFDIEHFKDWVIAKIWLV